MKKINLLILLLSFTTLITSFSITPKTKAQNIDREEDMRILNNATQQSVDGVDRDLLSKNAVSRATLPAVTQPVMTAGEIYFKGSAPDSYGHGIGLSQWGAYGAALKGWDYNKISTFYYKNTAVETRSDPGITVAFEDGTTQKMTMEEYVSGLGEVPSKACGTQAQIDAQNKLPKDSPIKEKYVLDNPYSIWDCWPEHSIKAQILAARSYAASYNGPICTTPYCQVYAGGTAKSWAAYETKNKYIISKGESENNQIIKAYYSANNNNGTGTADNDTVWGPKSGYGTAYSYLRTALDNTINYDVNMDRHKWNTSSYSMAELTNIFSWCSQYCNEGWWIKDTLLTPTRGFQSLSLEKDPSGRVKRVLIKGKSGETVSVAGWYFAKVINSWINDNTPSTVTPYFLESVTFDIANVAPPTAVYRFWSNQNQVHFYTGSAAEKDAVIAKYPENVWAYEGIAFDSLKCGTTGASPVFRFWSDQEQSHFYTIDEYEKQVVIDKYPDYVWKYEMVAFCARKTADTGFLPVYRFWSDRMKVHFYTIDEGEKNQIISNVKNKMPGWDWKLEGTAFYAKKI